ncbi:monocarboxylate transporter 9a [Triplophysa dalaica]|uniref:monocarboxylate transporter 9a n=1 Tax=Triplophysa dalaica TaxID=1582913 RepID=UPI0024DFF5A0|nr:monocarboxylate transporter 9a [Triplophysa dalaica]XP_056623908.1 monocarboxylate transporter 9a [Triplophysa dalaica]XP_056623910.1 monocarboxylate transporter 9a [Triplophysa dalaica]XP_056623911.1 monocarboxylate transporter 9a [Triplophysa dalaica]
MGALKAESALDGGWGWIIVLASFMAQLLSFGSPQSVGVLYPEWLIAFQEGKGMTAWVGSMVSGVALITSPVCSACVENFGARPVTVFSGVMVAGGLMLSAFAPNVSFLIFSYGIVVGMGCGLVYAATLTITCQYFEKRRGLALGLVTTGTSVGGFIYATVQNELIDLFGLEGCLLIIGALALNLMACAIPMRPLNLPAYYLKQKAALQRTEEPLYTKPTAIIIDLGNIKTTPGSADNTTALKVLVPMELKVLQNTEGNTRGGLLSCSIVARVVKKWMRPYGQYLCDAVELLQDRVFVSFCIAMFLFSLGAFPPVLFMEDVAQSEGLIDGIALIPLVSIVAFTTGIGKMVLGILADMRWVNSLFLYTLTLMGAGVALLLIPLSKSYLGLQVLSAMVGFFSGNWSLTSYITTTIVGIERLSQAHGILMCFAGFGIMLGPPVVGWFFDWTQSYDLAFYFSGTCVVVSSLFLFLATLPCWKKMREKENSPAEEDVNNSQQQHSSECDKVASVA